jgi:hypothetical protein
MVDATTRRAARTATLVAVPVALVAGLVAYWAIGGFSRSSGPVDIAAPPLGDRPAQVCRALLARLPDRLGDLPRRRVLAGPEQNAAYGDPPVTLACGAPGPSVPADAQLLVLDQVCWYAEQRPDAAVWTVLNREVPITVRVPARYEGPSRFVIALSAPIIAEVPQTPGRCD